MRCSGSNTSIFSSRSSARGDMLGNIAGKCCLGNWGSCFTYLRALSLRRNFRLVSSGVPNSCEAQGKKINALQPLHIGNKPYLEELLYALFLLIFLMFHLFNTIYNYLIFDPLESSHSQWTKFRSQQLQRNRNHTLVMSKSCWR